MKPIEQHYWTDALSQYRCFYSTYPLGQYCRSRSIFIELPLDHVLIKLYALYRQSDYEQYAQSDYSLKLITDAIGICGFHYKDKWDYNEEGGCVNLSPLFTDYFEFTGIELRTAYMGVRTDMVTTEDWISYASKKAHQLYKINQSPDCLSEDFQELMRIRKNEEELVDKINQLVNSSDGSMVEL